MGGFPPWLWWFLGLWLKSRCQHVESGPTLSLPHTVMFPFPRFPEFSLLGGCPSLYFHGPSSLSPSSLFLPPLLCLCISPSFFFIIFNFYWSIVALQQSESAMEVFVTWSCPTLCDPMDCSPSGSFVHGILQARILEGVAIPFFRGIFPTQGSNLGLLHCRQILYHLSHQGSP